MSSPDVDISASQFSNHGGGEHFGISERKSEEHTTEVTEQLEK